MSNPLSARDGRGVSPVISVILMTAVVIIIAAVLSVFVLGIGDSLNESQPTVSVEASFDARGSLEPHWIFNITHVSGDNIAGGELKIKLVDNFGNEATRTYPEKFTAGETIRMGLWGSPNRATNNNAGCTLNPEDPPGANNDQLVDVDPPASKVTISVIHEPSNSLMDRVAVDLGDYPDRYGTRLIDGSNPSFDCDDVDWDG